MHADLRFLHSAYYVFAVSWNCLHLNACVHSLAFPYSFGFSMRLCPLHYLLAHPFHSCTRPLPLFQSPALTRIIGPFSLTRPIWLSISNSIVVHVFAIVLYPFTWRLYAISIYLKHIRLNGPKEWSFALVFRCATKCAPWIKCIYLCILFSPCAGVREHIFFCYPTSYCDKRRHK